MNNSELAVADLVPAGWFMTWTWLDIHFTDAKVLRKEWLFFTSLSAIKIEFQTDHSE